MTTGALTSRYGSSIGYVFESDGSYRYAPEANFTGTDSILASKTDGLNVSIKSVAAAREKFSDRLTEIEARYRAQFTSLDTLLSSMQSTQSYLTTQLASIAANSSS